MNTFWNDSSTTTTTINNGGNGHPICGNSEGYKPDPENCEKYYICQRDGIGELYQIYLDFLKTGTMLAPLLKVLSSLLSYKIYIQEVTFLGWNFL